MMMGEGEGERDQVEMDWLWTGRRGVFCGWVAEEEGGVSLSSSLRSHLVGGAEVAVGGRDSLVQPNEIKEEPRRSEPLKCKY